MYAATKYLVMIMINFTFKILENNVFISFVYDAILYL